MFKLYEQMMEVVMGWFRNAGLLKTFYFVMFLIIITIIWLLFR